MYHSLVYDLSIFALIEVSFGVPFLLMQLLPLEDNSAALIRLLASSLTRSRARETVESLCPVFQVFWITVLTPFTHLMSFFLLTGTFWSC